jgi:hypothetical protein
VPDNSTRDVTRSGHPAGLPSKSSDRKDLQLADQDAAGDAIDAVRKMPGAVEDALRDYIEKNLSTVAVASALVWFIGWSPPSF